MQITQTKTYNNEKKKKKDETFAEIEKFDWFFK